MDERVAYKNNLSRKFSNFDKESPTYSTDERDLVIYK